MSKFLKMPVFIQPQHRENGYLNVFFKNNQDNNIKNFAFNLGVSYPFPPYILILTH